MVGLIKGKQIDINTISKENLNLSLPTVSKDPITKGYLDVRTINGKPLSTNITLVKSDFGLSNVDNTSDISKPVSTPQKVLIDTKLAQGTITQLKALSDNTITSFEITDKGRSGIFYYDSTDTTSVNDDSMIIVVGNRRFKRPFDGKVKPEWFGVPVETTYIDESVNMLKAINYLKSKGGGVLNLAEKTYYCNIIWRGNDNISIQGISPEKTFLQSVNENDFSIKIDGGQLSNGCFLRDITITGQGQINRRRHGIYFNCGSIPYLDNVVIANCAIGIFLNGTINGHFNRPIIRGNYVGVYITTVHGNDATITNVVEGTTEFSLTVSDAADTHPAQHTFIAPFFFANTFHYIVDNKSSFPADANIKIFGGSMEGSACGVVIESHVGLLEQPMIWEGIWLENTSFNPQPHIFNGKTYQPRDLTMNGGQAIITGSFITKMHVDYNGIIEFNNCNFYDTYDGQLTSANGGTFIGHGLKGYNTFLPYNFESGITDAGALSSIGFYTSFKTNLSLSNKLNKIYSNTHLNNIDNNFGATQTLVSGGIMGNTCQNIVALQNQGYYADVNITEGKIYASCMAIRSIESGFNLRHASTGGSHQFINTTFGIVPEWKSIVIIGRANSSGADGSLISNPNSTSKTWQTSGWQILEFNNVGELNEFLNSSNFVVDKLYPLDLTDTITTTIPTKSSLNTTYGTELANSKVKFTALSGGIRVYRKINNINTSDWEEYVWSTGITTIIS